MLYDQPICWLKSANLMKNIMLQVVMDKLHGTSNTWKDPAVLVLKFPSDSVTVVEYYTGHTPTTEDMS